uniref:Uncharacterized protein n=1 Tax=Caenorhabditis japonica TaxID=281687 RepID=A0A8R1E706_CAEJA
MDRWIDRWMDGWMAVDEQAAHCHSHTTTAPPPSSLFVFFSKKLSILSPTRIHFAPFPWSQSVTFQSDCLLTQHVFLCPCVFAPKMAAWSSG